jgi:Zn-finger nucleic acid-binding protein
MSGGPYREGPSFLICPRCGEILDRAFDDILACSRCKGILITPPTAGLAFDDPAWPKDTSAMWWKSSLACPVCASAGASTVMAAHTFEGTQIDRCAAHGLWLDAGELSRLTRTTGDELAFLRTKIRGEGADGNELDTKREQLRRDVEARRRIAEQQEASRAAERAKQIEEADRRHEAERRATEEQKRLAAAWAAPRAPSGPLFDPTEPRLLTVEPPNVEPPKPASPRVEAPKVVGVSEAQQPRPYAPQLTSREQLEREIWLGERRTELVRAIGTLEDELIETRAKVREIEGKLAAERARLRMLLEYGR